MSKYLWLLFLLIPTYSFAAPPVLNFSDIISGPATGVGDGLGSGAIVTIWGNNLGSSQGSSTVTVCGTSPAYIYYWQNADGTKPGGPSDLYTSHHMQEIAFSLPSSCTDGATTISVTVGGSTSNTLPFTVRSGNIYHAMTTGSSSGTGTYSDPWGSVYEGGLSGVSGGDILYIHDGITDENTYDSKYGILVSGKTSSESLQRAYVVYPNSRYMVRGSEKGWTTYESDSIVLSKANVEAGYYDEPAESSTTALGTTGGTGIKGSKDGRIVGNAITDIAGKCNSGWAGAIVSSAGGASYDYTGNLKVFGNYIHDWGCPQTSHFEHTTYISVRNGGYTDVDPWEMAWNRLEDNDAKYGIHNYDETYDSGDDQCGSPTGVVKIHHNYIKNQKGPGLSLGCEAPSGYVCWDSGSFDIYENVVINSGLGPEYTDNHSVEEAAIQIRDSGISSPVRVYNNTVYTSGETGSNGNSVTLNDTTNDGNLTVTFTNNIVYSNNSSDFFNVDTSVYTLSGSHNSFTSSNGVATSTIPSVLTDNITTGVVFSSEAIPSNTSTTVDGGTTGISSYDLYGVSRPQSSWDVGAYEYLNVLGRSAIGGNSSGVFGGMSLFKIN